MKFLICQAIRRRNVRKVIFDSIFAPTNEVEQTSVEMNPEGCLIDIEWYARLPAPRGLVLGYNFFKICQSS